MIVQDDHDLRCLLAILNDPTQPSRQDVASTLLLGRQTEAKAGTLTVSPDQLRLGHSLLIPISYASLKRRYFKVLRSPLVQYSSSNRPSGHAASAGSSPLVEWRLRSREGVRAVRGSVTASGSTGRTLTRTSQLRGCSQRDSAAVA